ncbi:hypothetical protein EUTSA_v10023206mg [Eutrema salsugineum]|uniref:Uncharacterized protein n=1 Tax=Eutrema salsugineum TaxID=72664 RepID=V4M480_EUTSA|nr:uncharacterized protein LOC18025870 [Eutrema salsugineum]ESQ50994.1 hypothetical protein EUTSA_v10023206mg [Eutrema salsugineum]
MNLDKIPNLFAKKSDEALAETVVPTGSEQKKESLKKTKKLRKATSSKRIDDETAAEANVGNTGVEGDPTDLPTLEVSKKRPSRSDRSGELPQSDRAEKRTRTLPPANAFFFSDRYKTISKLSSDLTARADEIIAEYDHASTVSKTKISELEGRVANMKKIAVEKKAAASKKPLSCKPRFLISRDRLSNLTPNEICYQKS